MNKRTADFNHVHVVFATKYRESNLDDAWRNDLFAFMAGLLRERGVIVREVGGYFDHVHLLFDLPPKWALSMLMKEIKAHSANWIRERTGFRFRWQSGFAVFSVSRQHLDAAKRYVANQVAHHRLRTFAEEFEWFLKMVGADANGPKFSTDDGADDDANVGHHPSG